MTRNQLQALIESELRPALDALDRGIAKNYQKLRLVTKALKDKGIDVADIDARIQVETRKLAASRKVRR